MPIDDTERFEIQVQPQNPLYRGTTTGLQTYLGAGAPHYYGVCQTDIDRAIAMGCNIMGLTVTWPGNDSSSYDGALEPDEIVLGNPDLSQHGPGYDGYSAISLARIHSVVDRIENSGLPVLLVTKTCKGGASGYSATYNRWTDSGNTARNEIVDYVYNGTTYQINGYGADYVNLDTQPNTSVPSGRTRYNNFLKLLCDEFPNAGILPHCFPYHMSGSLLSSSNPLLEARWHAYYDSNGAQKSHYDTIRQRDIEKGRPPRLIVLEPLLQGIWIPGTGSTSYVTGGLYWTAGSDSQNGHWNGKIQQPYYNDPLVFYAVNTHNGGDYFGNIAREGIDWDYNMTQFDAQWSGAQWWHQNHQPSNLFNWEYIGLCIREYFHAGSGSEHGGNYTLAERPIDASRIAWVKACFDKAIEYDMGWTYYGLGCSTYTSWRSSEALLEYPQGTGLPPEWIVPDSDGIGLGSWTEIGYILYYYNTLSSAGTYTWLDGSLHTQPELPKDTNPTASTYGKGTRYYLSLCTPRRGPCGTGCYQWSDGTCHSIPEE